MVEGQDVFEMETVRVDGVPAFRLEKDDVACGLERPARARGTRQAARVPRAPTSDRAWVESHGVVDEGETP